MTIFYSTDTLPKLKGRQELLYFQVRLCVRWKDEKTNVVLKSFEQNHMIFSIFSQIAIDYDVLLISFLKLHKQ